MGLIKSIPIDALTGVAEESVINFWMDGRGVRRAECSVVVLRKDSTSRFEVEGFKKDQSYSFVLKAPSSSVSVSRPFISFSEVKEVEGDKEDKGGSDEIAGWSGLNASRREGSCEGEEGSQGGGPNAR